MLRELCDWYPHTVVIWDDSEKMDNVYEFTTDEFVLLARFFHICPFPSVVFKDEDMSDSHYNLFGDYIDENCNNIMSDETLVVDFFDDPRIAHVYNPGILLRYGIRTVLTDKGTLIYCDYSNYKGKALRLSEFCNRVMPASLFQHGCDTKLIIDDRVRVSPRYAYDGECISTDTTITDINEVTDGQQLKMFMEAEHWSECYKILHSNSIFTSNFLMDYRSSIIAEIIPDIPDDIFPYYKKLYRPEQFHIPFSTKNVDNMLIWYAFAIRHRILYNHQSRNSDEVIGKSRGIKGFDYEVGFNSKSALVYIFKTHDPDLMHEFAEYAESWFMEVCNKRPIIDKGVVVGV